MEVKIIGPIFMACQELSDAPVIKKIILILVVCLNSTVYIDQY